MKENLHYAKKFITIITIPSIVRPTPRALFIVFSDALFANLEVRRAAIKVKATQKIRIEISVIPPPIAKWETEPVRAVNVMMNTLVPTAVFNSYPRTLTSIMAVGDGTMVPVKTDKPRPKEKISE